MDILVKHYEALFNLLFGVAYAVAAVLVLVKNRSIVGMAMALWVGVASQYWACLNCRGA